MFFASHALTATPILNDEWAAAYEKAEAAVAKLSLEEKVNITTGTGFGNGKVHSSVATSTGGSYTH